MSVRSANSTGRCRPRELKSERTGSRTLANQPMLTNSAETPVGGAKKSSLILDSSSAQSAFGTVTSPEYAYLSTLRRPGLAYQNAENQQGRRMRGPFSTPPVSGLHSTARGDGYLRNHHLPLVAIEPPLVLAVRFGLVPSGDGQRDG